MIHDLLVRGVTVFPGSEHFEFVPGINVVVGGNDSGKSHLLKLCYTVAKWSADGGRKSLPEKWAEEQRLRKDLMRVFASRGLAGLTARNRGNAHAHVEASMEGDGVPEGMGNLVFDFQAGHEEEGLSIQEMPKRFLNVPVVFLAAREVLTIYPSFVQVGSRFPEFLDGGRKSLPEKWAEEQRLRKDLMRVFASRGLAGLTARNRGNAHARVEASMEGDGVPEGMGNLVFDFQAGHEEEGLSIREMPRRFLNVPVVFLAAREVLTIYPSFVQVGSRFPEFLDGGSWDLCRYLDMEAEAEPISTDAGRVVARLEKIIGGKVVKRDGRFFLQRPGQQPIEMSLVAEGFKRLGTLSYLIRNGSVKKGSVLFWDEPEMNLNASHLPVLVKTLTGLAKTGVQVILSSHSLFLLRELMIQLSEPRNAMVQRKFFGMSVPRGERSGVRVSWGESLEDVGPIESLEAEIEQADRYLKLSYES